MLSSQWSSLCAGIKSINYALHIHFRFPPRRPTSSRPLPSPRVGTFSELKDTCNGSKTARRVRTRAVIINNQSQQLTATYQHHHHLSTTLSVNDICSYWFVQQTGGLLIMEECKQQTLFCRAKARPGLDCQTSWV